MADSSQQYLDEGWSRGIRWIMCQFFGATAVVSHDYRDGKITINFVSRNSDNTARQERVYDLRGSNTPEENMRILLEARQRQAWFQRHSDDVDVSDIDPNEPLQEENLDLAECSQGEQEPSTPPAVQGWASREETRAALESGNFTTK